MGAALGGATGAPITAVIILFELTGEYSIILPLMAAVVMAAGTGNLLSKNTIYTAKLWRRGVDLDAPPSERMEFTAADIALAPPEPLSERASLGRRRRGAVDLAVRHAAGGRRRRTLHRMRVGTGRRRGARRSRSAGGRADRSSGCRRPSPLRRLPTRSSPNSSGRGGTGLPVLNEDRTQLIGWITYESVLARLRPDRPGRRGGGAMNMDMDTAPASGAALLTTWTSSPVADLLIAWRWSATSCW